MKLHFKGDVTESLLDDLNQLYGPNETYREFYEVTTAEYDSATNITTAYYKPVSYKRAEERSAQLHAQALEDMKRLTRAGLVNVGV